MASRTRLVALVTILVLTAALTAGCAPKPAAETPAKPAAAQPADQPVGGNAMMNPTAPANTARGAVGNANAAIGQTQQDANATVNDPATAPQQ